MFIKMFLLLTWFQVHVYMPACTLYVSKHLQAKASQDQARMLEMCAQLNTHKGNGGGSCTGICLLETNSDGGIEGTLW